jgi:thiamine monophosphate synthase
MARLDEVVPPSFEVERADDVVFPSPLLLITDRKRSTLALPDALHDAVKHGARWIRVREPDLDLFSYIALCHVLIDTVADPRVTWAVRPSAYAMLRTAYTELRLSVHCTERDAHFTAADVFTLVGRSVHAQTITQASAAHYLLLAPVFATASKPDAVPAGVEAIRTAALSRTAVVALGGVSPANVAACIAAGARAVAACGYVLDAEHPGARVRELLSALSEYEEILR